VAVNYRSREPRRRALVEAIVRGGGRAVAVAADVAREAEIVRMFDATERAARPGHEAGQQRRASTGGRAASSSSTRPVSPRCSRSTSSG
jgi:thiazole synthase ThiGH ThiG subunit